MRELILPARVENLEQVPNFVNVTHYAYESEDHKPYAVLLDDKEWKSDFVKDNFTRMYQGYL